MTDLITLQSIFKERLLRIPDYQRGYDWETEQRNDLLDDLDSIPEGKHHYTGTIVVHDTQRVENIFGETYKVLDVVDGQQRLTTLILLLNAIRNEFDRISNEVPDAAEYSSKLRDTYIRVKSQVGEFHKLTLQDESHAMFRSILSDAEHTLVDVEIMSQRNLLNASKEFDDYLERKYSSLHKTVDYFGWLQEFQAKITNQVRFNLYEIEEEAEVGVIFEVMNDRGKPLSQLEKVKNYLMYIAYKTSSDKAAVQKLVQNINDAWKAIFQNLLRAKKASSADEDQLLRFHWIVKYSPDSRNYDIHHSVKGRINLKRMKGDTCYKAIQDYVWSLKEMSIIYRDLFNPTADYAFEYIPSPFDDDVRDWLQKIVRLGSQATVFPLIMSAFKTWTNCPAKFVELCRLCEVYIFRVYEAVQRKSNTGLSRFNQLAYDVFRQSISPDQTLSAIKLLIRDYASDQEFSSWFGQPTRNYYDWDGLKYFLFELENHEVLKIKASFNVDWNRLQKRKRQETIEHVLPQTLTSEWGFTPEGHALYVNRLGNLTLTYWNGSLSNKSFHQKKGDPTDSKGKTYRNSVIQVEKAIAEYSDWTEKEIDDRTYYLTQFALQRWSV